MRIDVRADPLYVLWYPYDAERCAMLKFVVWMDDESAQYGQENGTALRTIQAKRIVFLPERKLAIVNPIGEPEEIVREFEEEATQ